MKWFRRTRSGLEPLEERLRSMRPEASSAFLESVAARIRAHAPRPALRPTLRHRTALALVLTAGLVAAAAAEGGLSYAATATDHTASAISRVFAVTGSGRDAASQHIATPAAQVSNTADTKSGKGDQDGDNPAGQEYVKRVYVCVTVPRNDKDGKDDKDGKHDKDGKGNDDDDQAKHITLLLPKKAADRLIDQGIATPGPC
jgi:hypothetical protein